MTKRLFSRPTRASTRSGGHSPVPAWSQHLSTSPVWFWQSLTTLVNPAHKAVPILHCTSDLGLAVGLGPQCPRRRLTANAPLRAPTRGGGMLGPILAARSSPGLGLVVHFQGSCLPYGRCSAALQFQLRRLHSLARRRVHRSSSGLGCYF